MILFLGRGRIDLVDCVMVVCPVLGEELADRNVHKGKAGTASGSFGCLRLRPSLVGFPVLCIYVVDSRVDSLASQLLPASPKALPYLGR